MRMEGGEVMVKPPGLGSSGTWTSSHCQWCQFPALTGMHAVLAKQFDLRGSLMPFKTCIP